LAKALPHGTPSDIDRKQKDIFLEEDLEIHAARMKVDPERTRDLMGRHCAMSEGLVNALMNHQGVRHACWKGLALTRFQVGLAIILGNCHGAPENRPVVGASKPARDWVGG
jgi:hypothetical protein